MTIHPIVSVTMAIVVVLALLLLFWEAAVLIYKYRRPPDEVPAAFYYGGLVVTMILCWTLHEGLLWVTRQVEAWLGVERALIGTLVLALVLGIAFTLMDYRTKAKSTQAATEERDGTPPEL